MKVFCDWDISKPNKDFQIRLRRKEAALLTCFCKIFLENFITAKEAIWQQPTEQWAHAIKLNNWRLCLYYLVLHNILMFGNTVQIHTSNRKPGTCKGWETAFTVCVSGEADGFLSHLRVLSSVIISRCAWPRWCTQWGDSSFPGLCASCSTELRRSDFLQRHRQCSFHVRKAQS